MIASPTKLRSGAWGARVESTAVMAGDTVTITTRNGKSWEALVTEVLWVGDDISICGTRHASERRARRPRCAECDTDAGVVEARDSSGLVDLCCHRCASYPASERSFA